MKGVHFKKKKKLLLIIYSPPCVIEDVHVFLSSFEKKLRFLMKTFQDFLHIMDFIGNQTVQGPNESFGVASKGFK